jgi:hypothetical protein
MKAFFSIFFCLLFLGLATKSEAIPLYSRRYNTSCTTCHTVAPRLNKYGQAFQANYFNLPKASFTAQKAIPVSLFVIGGSEKVQGEKSVTQLHEVELFASDSLALSNGLRGGYFLQGFPVTTAGVRSGTLENVYAAVPVGGAKGEWGLVVGQTSPMKYQYAPINVLSDAKPVALENTINEFSLAEASPTVRLDYFSNRGSESPDGNYYSIGVPFDGGLSFRGHSKWGKSKGIYAQAFQRQGAKSIGGIGYMKGNASLVSLVGTQFINEKWSANLIGSVGSAKGEKVRNVGLEADYLFGPGLALTSRLEVGQHKPFAVGTINFLPPKNSHAQLLLETSTNPDEKKTVLVLRLQF